MHPPAVGPESPVHKPTCPLDDTVDGRAKVTCEMPMTFESAWRALLTRRLKTALP